MQPSSNDLLVAALALGYRYCGLGDLRRGLRAAKAEGLAAALESAGVLSPRRAEKLRRGADLAARLRADAIYGVIALRNRLVSGALLNACMEECRSRGYERTLGEVLCARGVLSPEQHEAILRRREELTPQLESKERTLARAIDLERDGDELAELKLAVLFGEVAAKLSFLGKTDFEAALAACEARERGEDPSAAARRARETFGSSPAAGAGAAVSTAPGTGSPAASASSGTTPGSGSPDDDRDHAIKGYELLDKLGAGAMGAVLKARKLDSGEIVALKILKPQLAADREYVLRFQREAKAVGRLSHPSIVRALQVGRSGDYYFFAMEFVEGKTVAEILKERGRLDERTALRVVARVASALHHAWQHRIVHRDVKPDNIMLTTQGEVKLTDLGLARAVRREATLTITGVVMGSPAYLSPEQAKGTQDLDVRSDLYSLGATLFHMLTGKVPYDGESPLQVMLQHLNAPVPEVRRFAPEVSEATRLLLLRMMAKRPAERPQKASAVEAIARKIEEALARGETPAVPAALAPAGARPPASAPTAQAPTADAATPAPRPPARGHRASDEGSPKERKHREAGERLRRMARKRRRRF
ncbi:MAG: serine/threonine protein kinase [Planctomycetota bacterium]|nr:MAG: serine/threonine protein kinase [Planctomycetota bacterium]